MGKLPRFQHPIFSDVLIEIPHFVILLKPNKLNLKEIICYAEVIKAIFISDNSMQQERNHSI